MRLDPEEAILLTTEEYESFTRITNNPTTAVQAPIDSIKKHKESILDEEENSKA